MTYQRLTGTTVEPDLIATIAKMVNANWNSLCKFNYAHHTSHRSCPLIHGIATLLLDYFEGTTNNSVAIESGFTVS